jgi:hypothetical protein
MTDNKLTFAAMGVAIATLMSVSSARAQGVAPDGVYVDVRTNDARVRIDQVHPDGSTTPVCMAPCRQRLARDGLYAIGGAGIPGTAPFPLPLDRQDLVLSVRAGSKARRDAGIAGAVAGGTAAVVFMPGDQAKPGMGQVPLWQILLVLCGAVAGTAGAYLWWTSDTRVSVGEL